MFHSEYSRMRPLYEAMSVSSYTIERLEQREQEHSDFELQFNLAKLAKSLEELLDKPLPEEVFRAPAEAREFLIKLNGRTEILIAMVLIAIKKAHEALPTVSGRLKNAIELLVKQIETLNERLETVLDTWQIAADEGLAKKLDAALAEMENPPEFGDWRRDLELISG